ncbi:hypothetical protein [Cryptosporangium sp. NPDC048952]|uniref:hypothetical protein n=1 Tax=Cryptosporangium sp. NPDC048952 TaxID=3363961 RepID=UPI003719D40D
MGDPPGIGSIVNAPSPIPSGDSELHQTGLPLPVLQTASDAIRPWFWAVSPMGTNGRIAARSTLDVLRWSAGERVLITAAPGTLFVERSADGPLRIDPSGHLRLRAEQRHAARVLAGERLLLVADPPRDILVAWTPARLAPILSGLVRPGPTDDHSG